MNQPIPSIEDVRAALEPLSRRHLDRLEELSTVPATTIYKIKRGEIANPGLDTVRRFLPHISTVVAEIAAAAETSPLIAQPAAPSAG